MSPIHKIPPRVTVTAYSATPDRTQVAAVVLIEPAVGDPYTLTMQVDFTEGTINMPGWKELSDLQQQHARCWVGVIADNFKSSPDPDHPANRPTA